MSERSSALHLSEPYFQIENKFYPNEFPSGVETLQPGQEIDLSTNKNGDVIKKLVKLGHGTDFPCEGDKCEVKYTGYYRSVAEENIFDSSERDGCNFVFDVAKGKVVKGFELGISTMKVGEKAIISMHPDYGFGRAGRPPSIPANTWLIFDTEIVSISEEDYSKEHDRSLTKKILKRGSGWTFPNAGAMVDIHFKGWYEDNGGFTVFVDKEVKFPLEEGTHPNYNVPDFVEDLLRDMKKAEISRFRMASRHCYGEKGCPKLNIPPNKDLTFQIHQKNFERVKDIWEMNNTEKLDQCAIFKDKGNDFFKKGILDLASTFYSKVLENLDYDECMEGEEEERRVGLLKLARLNLAQVCLKQKKYIKVLEYCNNALKLDKDNVKAFYRRGMANFELKNFEDAKEDFERILKLEPLNKEAKRQSDLCDKNITTAYKAERLLAKNMMSEIGQGAGRGTGYASGMEDIGDWSNDMAAGMITIEQESEAFGEPFTISGVEQG